MYDSLRIVNYLLNSENTNQIDQLNNMNYYCRRHFNKLGFNEVFNVEITSISREELRNQTCKTRVENFKTIKSLNDISTLNETSLNLTLSIVAVMVNILKLESIHKILFHRI